jgi:hypothetical protein
VWGAGLLLVAVLAACSGDVGTAPPPDFLELREREPKSETYNVRYRYSIQGRRKAVVTARHLAELLKPYERREVEVNTDDPGANNLQELAREQLSNTYQLADSGVLIEFYAPDGSLESRLSAHRAELYNDEGRATALGNVIVQNAKGDKLETERLNWLRDRDSLYTPSAVTITTGEEIIFGDSMVANTSFTWYRIYHIRGVMKLRE